MPSLDRVEVSEFRTLSVTRGETSDDTVSIELGFDGKTLTLYATELYLGNDDAYFDDDDDDGDYPYGIRRIPGFGLTINGVRLANVERVFGVLPYLVETPSYAEFTENRPRFLGRLALAVSLISEGYGSADPTLSPDPYAFLASIPAEAYRPEDFNLIG